MHLSPLLFRLHFFAFDDPKIPASIQRPSGESHRMTLTHSHGKNVQYFVVYSWMKWNMFGNVLLVHPALLLLLHITVLSLILFIRISFRWQLEWHGFEGAIHSNEYSLYLWIALPTRCGMNVLTVALSIAMTLQFETENDIAISCQRHQLKRPFSFHLPQLFSPFTQWISHLLMQMEFSGAVRSHRSHRYPWVSLSVEVTYGDARHRHGFGIQMTWNKPSMCSKLP